MTEQESSRETIEQLTKRYQNLDKRKTTAEANLETAGSRLEELKKEAREKYGTDDLEELRKKLSEMETENERKRAEYQESLDRIEKDLEEVEKKYKTEDNGS
ncbi:MAG: hypothetical protein ACLFV2_00375 [Desulfurivibrionaceae bacterium]